MCQAPEGDELSILDAPYLINFYIKEEDCHSKESVETYAMQCCVKMQRWSFQHMRGNFLSLYNHKQGNVLASDYWRHDRYVSASDGGRGRGTKFKLIASKGRIWWIWRSPLAGRQGNKS